MSSNIDNINGDHSYVAIAVSAAIAVVGLACLVLLAGGFWLLRDIPVLVTVPRQNIELKWSIPPAPGDYAWSAVGRIKGSQPAKEPSSDQYRLAGIFSTMGRNGLKKAIIDDLKQGQQYLLSEGEETGGLVLEEIFSDHVTVRAGTQKVDLWMSFVSRGSQETAQSGTEQPEVLEENRFGKRVGKNRWVISKETLKEYYQEMMDHPDRAAKLFESLRPDYNENQKIQGYILDVVGEGDFFEAIGLEEGDKVREVNTMRMSSRRRAEYFIREFANDRLGAVVLDIEREGNPERMVYLLR